MTRRPLARSTSLLAALFGRIGVLFLLIVLAVGSIAFFTAQRRINEIYDGQLIVGANVLRALMDEEVREEPATHDISELQVDDAAILSPDERQAFNDYADWRMFRIWRGAQVVIRSDTGPPLVAPSAQNGFSDVAGPKYRWRVYTLHVPRQRVVVQIGERTDIRLVLVRGIALGLALPLLLLIPTAAVLIWLSLSDGLQALRTLISEIGRRTLRDLSPLPLEPWPRDLHPLVRSINRLFERIDRSLQHERRFLDDAAHQLRTPLAAVKLQTQLIAGEDDPAERQAMTAQLVESVDRASALTDRLLTLARLEASRAPSGKGGDLREETVAALADLAPVAARRQVELSFEGRGRFASGDPALLRLIATNLVENAITHAPERSEVAVRLSSSGGRHRLVVTDGGPGIPAGERDKVLERFHRGPSASPSGAGLGLSIVGEAVRLLKGRLQLRDRDDGAPGLCVEIEVPEAE
ncbi:MAG TPA: ATP-binding protein [Phenylobacterium sp.]|uniref:ATP-binding protein n=1 Tax=Phenylobacterium sp. TaxID=1871053 RepID=UPI002C07C6D9|nr:ATP-binding protein [Phenylobacterium sp.]HSV03566.1 ATP-binding protein [Phenylobacterium sp.]